MCLTSFTFREMTSPATQKQSRAILICACAKRHSGCSIAENVQASGVLASI
jgi:hypothetical protein